MIVNLNSRLKFRYLASNTAPPTRDTPFGMAKAPFGNFMLAIQHALARGKVIAHENKPNILTIGWHMNGTSKKNDFDHS
ncbi:MAG: hypothetical protein ACRBCJ_05430 [Hyphomicrobiaceae bacterium]